MHHALGTLLTFVALLFLGCSSPGFVEDPHSGDQSMEGSKVVDVPIGNPGNGLPPGGAFPGGGQAPGNIGGSGSQPDAGKGGLGAFPGVLTTNCQEELVSGQTSTCEVFLNGQPLRPASGMQLGKAAPPGVSFDPATGVLTLNSQEMPAGTTALTVPFESEGAMANVVIPLSIKPGAQVCTAGTKLGIWLDENDDGQKDADGFLGDVIAFQGAETAAKNYNYFSASAHPLTGPKTIDFASNVFFYEGSDGLALTIFHNTENSNPSPNSVNWQISVSGNQGKDKVLLADDPKQKGSELSQAVADAAATKYAGTWHYQENTDGGVIGPFDGQQFSIAVKPQDSGNIKKAAFYSADGQTFSLLGEDGAISSFIIAYHGQSLCTPSRK